MKIFNEIQAGWWAGQGKHLMSKPIDGLYKSVFKPDYTDDINRAVAAYRKRITNAIGRTRNAKN